jgi:hypothetical protein
MLAAANGPPSISASSSDGGPHRGLLVRFFALNVHAGMPGWVGRFAALSAVLALAL